MKMVRVNNDRARPRTIAKTTNAAQTGQLVGDNLITAGLIGGDVGDKKAARNHGGGVSVLSDTLFVVQNGSPRAPTRGT